MELTLAQLNEAGSALFPGLLGIEFDGGRGRRRPRAPRRSREKHLAPNGYLHAGAVVALADTACGYGCILNLPGGRAPASRRSS